jgi:hypothetical protein
VLGYLTDERQSVQRGGHEQFLARGEPKTDSNSNFRQPVELPFVAQTCFEHGHTAGRFRLVTFIIPHKH